MNKSEIYRSPDYDPSEITNRYLHIRGGKPCVHETIAVPDTRKGEKRSVTGLRSNYTYRTAFLPESDYDKYAKAIEAAREIEHNFPNCVEIFENGSYR